MISLKHFMLLHDSIFEAQNVVTDSRTWGKQFCCEIPHWLLEWQSLGKLVFTHLCFSLCFPETCGCSFKWLSMCHSSAGVSVQLPT